MWHVASTQSRELICSHIDDGISDSGSVVYLGKPSKSVEGMRTRCYFHVSIAGEPA